MGSLLCHGLADLVHGLCDACGVIVDNTGYLFHIFCRSFQLSRSIGNFMNQTLRISDHIIGRSCQLLELVPSSGIYPDCQVALGNHAKALGNPPHVLLNTRYNQQPDNYHNNTG